MLSSFLVRTNGVVILLALACAHLCILYKSLFPRSRFTQAFLSRLQANKSILAHIAPYAVFGVGLSVVASLLSLGGEGHGEVLLQHISIKSIVRNALYYLGVFGEFLLCQTSYPNP